MSAPSIVTQAFIVQRYGLRLNIEDMAGLLRLEKQTIYNQISAGTFPIKTYQEGTRRYADYRDVAAYLDQMQALAA